MRSTSRTWKVISVTFRREIEIARDTVRCSGLETTLNILPAPVMFLGFVVMLQEVGC